MSNKKDSRQQLAVQPEANNLRELRGGRLTPLRRQVLDILLEAAEPVKAYAIMDLLREKTSKSVTPASVYRTLDFLQHRGLVHRVGTLNAFVACTDTCGNEHEPVFMLVCAGCHQSREISDQTLYNTIYAAMREKKFTVQGDTIELTGICPQCAGSRAQEQQKGTVPS